MGQAVEHCSGHLGATEDLRPVCEGEVGGDDGRGVFVKLRDQVEQELRAGLAEGQIAQFTDDDEVMAQQHLDKPAAFTGGFLLLQLVDEVDEIEEAAPGAGADHGGRDGDGEMGLAGSRAADVDQIALGFDEVAGGAPDAVRVDAAVQAAYLGHR
jgi:hypothetical protein